MVECKTTNKDCERCCEKTMVDDGGGDYEDMQPYCIMFERMLGYIKEDNKPCELKIGEYYTITKYNLE